MGRVSPSAFEMIADARRVYNIIRAAKDSV
jgi:hypothetical protein